MLIIMWVKKNKEQGTPILFFYNAPMTCEKKVEAMNRNKTMLQDWKKIDHEIKEICEQHFYNHQTPEKSSGA